MKTIADEENEDKFGYVYAVSGPGMSTSILFSKMYSKNLNIISRNM